MEYRKKRLDAGLTIYTVSRALGIDYDTYKEVEKGNIVLDGDRLDKFLEIINNAFEYKLITSQKLVAIKEWVSSGKFKEQMKKMGFTSQRYLSEVMGIPQSQVSYFLTGDSKIAQDIPERIYDFLNDSINKQVDNGEEKKMFKRKKKETKIKDEELLIPCETGVREEETVLVESLKDIKIHELEKEVSKLKHQIEMYERLIERL